MLTFKWYPYTNIKFDSKVDPLLNPKLQYAEFSSSPFLCTPPEGDSPPCQHNLEDS